MFMDSTNYSDATSNRNIRTAIEGNEDRKQERRTSISTGDSTDDVRYRMRMSIADDLATMARAGGNIVYYTGQGIGQGINVAIDAHFWWNEDDEEDEIEPPIDEEVFTQTQGLLRSLASRSRSPLPEEQASGSNDAVSLLRRGTSNSRSRSETPPKKNQKKININII